MIKPVATFLACAALVAIPATATTPVSSHYNVTMKVYDGGVLTASPSLITKSGEPAQFVKGEPHQYFQLVATPTAHDRFHLNSNLVQWTPKGLMNDGETLEAVVGGEPSIIVLGKYSSKTGQLHPLRIEVSINKVPAPK